MRQNDEQICWQTVGFVVPTAMRLLITNAIAIGYKLVV
jgi:hypothetical protein